ncbi:MAG: PLP-dependent aminotransferase family protein [Saprospiraceae bacterium]
MASQSKEFRYNQIANQLEDSILNSILKVGEKLPSVRLLSKQQHVSPSTIFKAYYQLEAKGLIEARPKSGYYVRFRHAERPAPATSPSIQPNVKAIDTSEIIKELEELRSSEKLLKLSSAVPSPKLLPIARLNKSIMEAVRTEKNFLLRYTHPQGNPELRRIIAQQLLNWGGNFRAEDLVITAGCMEALNISLMILTKPGDVIAIDELTYFSIHQAVERLGLKAVSIPVTANGLDISFLKKAIEQFPIKAGLFVTNFHNPTGVCIPDEQKKALVELMMAKQIPIIEDDIYGELYFGKNRPSTCKFYDKEGWVLYCSSLSKTIAPGYRIGYCQPGRFVEQFAHQKRILSLSTSSLPQAALLNFFQKGRYDFHLRKLRTALHTQALRYSQCILQHFPTGIYFRVPEGGFNFWIEFPKQFDSYQLFRAAKSQQISIAPGQVFSVESAYKHCIRLSFAEPFTEEIEEGIRQLGELAQKQLEHI